MPRLIHILIGAHLSTAPRAQKEALALMEGGFDVAVSGVWFDGAAAANDQATVARTGIRFTPALDFRGGTAARELRRASVRFQARWARERFARQDIFSPRLLGYGAPELLRHELRRAADLTIVHSEAGLWVAQELARQGHRVGLDFEDWFSRDLPPGEHRHRPVESIANLERVVAHAASYVLAPSQAMARALAKAYSIPSPAVIYNSFPWAERAGMDGLRKDRRDAETPSLHWFSQTIGPHRGLELLLGALPLLKNHARLYLRGAYSPSARRWLDALIPAECRERVAVLPLVPSHELLSRIAEHDIGFALESPEIPSRDLCASNKLFHYLQAGLAVIATDTQGQAEVLRQCGEAGVLLPETTSPALARAINRYLSDPALLARAKRAALAAAEDILAWEHQKEKIVFCARRACAG
jgi:glycosyltransferase involved in cell wall biosynthesis